MYKVIILIDMVFVNEEMFEKVLKWCWLILLSLNVMILDGNWFLVFKNYFIRGYFQLELFLLYFIDLRFIVIMNILKD